MAINNGDLLPPVYAAEVMFSQCLSVCESVRAVTFEPADIETLFLVWWYILTISKFDYQGHWVKVKVTQWKMLIFYLDINFTCLTFLSGQGHKLVQGHLTVKVKVIVK